jgi:hypothetical protein
MSHDIGPNEVRQQLCFFRETASPLGVSECACRKIFGLDMISLRTRKLARSKLTLRFCGDYVSSDPVGHDSSFLNNTSKTCPCDATGEKKLSNIRGNRELK